MVTPMTIHVDPAGDDSATGLAGSPIKTLDEAARRCHPMTDGITVALSAGTHVLTDHYQGFIDNGVNTSLFFQNQANGLKLQGAQGPVTAAFTILSRLDNVITLTAPVLTPGAHFGEYWEWDYYGYPIIALVIANTEDTFTVAYTSVSMGGFLAPPNSGASKLRSFATKVQGPATNGFADQNRLNFGGNVSMNLIHFDGSTSPSWNGPITNDQGARGAISVCKFTDLGVSFDVSGDLIIGSCWFESDGAGKGIGIRSFGNTCQTSENVFVDLEVAHAVGEYGTLFLLSGSSSWNLGCYLFIESDGASLQDRTRRTWVDPGPTYGSPNYVRCDKINSGYLKIDAPLTGMPGHRTYGTLFESLDGGSTFNLRDSAAGTVLSSQYVKTEDLSLSKTDYVAGNTFGTPLRYNDDRGNFFYL